MLLTSSPSQSNGTVWHYALRHHEAVFHPDGELPLMTLFCLYSAYFSLINSLIKLTLIFLLFNYPCLFPSSVSENIKLLYEPVMPYLLYLHLLHLPVCSRPCCYPAHGLPISPLSDSLWPAWWTSHSSFNPRCVSICWKGQCALQRHKLFRIGACYPLIHASKNTGNRQEGGFKTSKNS